MSERTVSVKEQLLTISEAICRQAPHDLYDQAGQRLWWANVTELQPGLGLEAHLSGSLYTQKWHVRRAELYVFDQEAETSSIVVKRSSKAEWFEDQFAQLILEAFKNLGNIQDLPITGEERFHNYEERLCDFEALRREAYELDEQRQLVG